MERKLFKLADCEALKRLDQTVYADACGVVETHRGEVKVRKALTAGYVAEINTAEDLPSSYAYGPTPSIALLNLIDTLEREKEETKRATVILFPQAA